MAAVGLAEETQSAILRLVSAVLWLGNVAFAASGSGEVGPRDAAAREALEHAAPLLGVDVATLTKSLTHGAATLQAKLDTLLLERAESVPILGSKQGRDRMESRRLARTQLI